MEDGDSIDVVIHQVGGRQAWMVSGCGCCSNLTLQKLQQFRWSVVLNRAWLCNCLPSLELSCICCITGVCLDITFAIGGPEQCRGCTACIFDYIEKADPLSNTSVSSCSASISEIASISRSCNKIAKFGGTSVFWRWSWYSRNLCSTGHHVTKSASSLCYDVKNQTYIIFVIFICQQRASSNAILL